MGDHLGGRSIGNEWAKGYLVGFTQASGDRWGDLLLAAFILSLAVSITLSQSLLTLLVLFTLIQWRDSLRRQWLTFPLVWPLGAFFGLSLLSAALSPDPWRSLFVSKSLLLILTFYLVVNRVQSFAHLLRLLYGFFGIMSAMALYGLFQVVACRTALPVPSVVEAILRVRLSVCRPWVSFRANGPFSIYMTYAGVLLQSLVLLTGHWAVLPFRRGWPLALGGLVQLAALGATLARNAWLGLGVGVLTLLALERRLKILAIFGAVGLMLLLSPLVLRRVGSMVDPADPTFQERLYMWGSGLQMVADRPLTGIGAGRVGAEYSRYHNPQAREPGAGHLHNSALQIAAERGLLGLGAWLWIWVAFFRRGWHILRSVPPDRAAERGLVSGSLAAVGGFLAAGLFEYNFGDAEVVTVTYVVMALPFLVEKWIVKAKTS